MDKLLYVTDEELQSQLAPKCDLLIHIGLDSFQYAVINNGFSKLMLLAEYSRAEDRTGKDSLGDIKELPEFHKEFKYPFNRIIISYESSNFTLIPSELFSEDSIKFYQSYLKSSESDEVLVSKTADSKIRSVSLIASELKNAFVTSISKPLIYDDPSSFINAIMHYNNGASTKLFVDIQKRHTRIASLRNNELLFYNLFETANSDEVLYYLLGLSSQFALDNSNLKLILSGNIMEGDELHQKLEQAFSALSFADSASFVHIPDSFRNTPSHRYFRLISLLKCV